MVPARLAALLALVVAVLLAMPAAVLAADPVTITGTVVRAGAPVTGVQVVVSVTGSDQVAAGSTDEQGGFAVQVEAEAGSQVRIDVTGQTSRSEPDAQNCVHLETPTGSLTFTIDALPPPAVEVAMDDVLTGLVCGPTPTPRITPPSTDAPVARSGGPGAGLLVVLGTVLLLSGAVLAVGRPRPAAVRRRVGR